VALSAVLAFLLAGLQAGAAGSGTCPPEGAAQTPKLQALNVQRNRTDAPSDSDIDDTATLEAILESGPDQDRWDASNGVEVTAFVVSVTDGGFQSADCFKAREIRFDLSANSAAFDPGHRFVAIVTPAWRRQMSAQGVDWSLGALQSKYQGQFVKIRGWFLFNSQAKARAVNTASDEGANITRATAWEIHPVTAIRLETDPFEQ
jgi:hypothetical protein